MLMSCDKKGACGRRIVSVRKTVSREFALCVEGEGQTGASPKPLGRGPGPAYLLSAVSVNKDGKTPAVCCGPGTGRQPGTSATPRECRVLPLVPAEVDVTAHVETPPVMTFASDSTELCVVKTKKITRCLRPIS